MTMKILDSNVGIIGDTHIPFEHEGYLDFCIETFEKRKCKTIIHIGDVIDNHAISYHEHDPNGLSPADELKLARKKLQRWFKAFPKVKVCKGNHDELTARKALTAGIPKEMIRSFREIWEFPKGWEYDWNYTINGVLYSHGGGFGGKFPHANATIAHRQSCVIGHFHSVAGVEWTASEKDILFGLSTGCGIDRKQYAFVYGRDFIRKPILGCGVVTHQGRNAEFIPMFMK